MKNIIFLLIIFISINGFLISQERNYKYNNYYKDALISIKNLEAKKHFIDGLTNSLQERSEKAILEFQEALLFEENPAIYFAIGRELQKIEKFEFSQKYFDKLLSYPDSILQPYYLFGASQFYYQIYEFGKAANLLHRIIKLDSTNIDAYFALGSLYDLTNTDSSEIIYKKILEIDPENTLALEKLYEYYIAKPNYDKCEKVLESLVYIEPDNFEWKELLISIYFIQNKKEEAKKFILEWYEKYSENPFLNLLIADYLLDEKNYSEALHHIDVTFAELSDKTDFNLDAYKILFRRAYKDSSIIKPLIERFELRFNNKDTLASSFLLALKIINNENIEKKLMNFVLSDNRSRENFKLIAYEIYRDEDYENTIRLLTPIISYYENDVDFTSTLGFSYLQVSSYNDAAKYFSKAIEHNPENPDLLVLMGYTLGKMKNYDEAIEYCRKALKIDSKNHSALVNLPMLLKDAGYYTESDSVYEEALQIYPDDSMIMNNYAYSLAERKYNLERALELSKKSLEKDSLVDSYLDTLGWIYFQMGDYETAAKYIQLAIDQGSPSAEILEHMGDVSMKLNKIEDAREYYELALKLDPENESIKQKLKEIK